MSNIYHSLYLEFLVGRAKLLLIDRSKYIAFLQNVKPCRDKKGQILKLSANKPGKFCRKYGLFIRRISGIF
jgi:hypothetical protein